jgi:putative PEP-CTERM system integral membrane protein
MTTTNLQSDTSHPNPSYSSWQIFQFFLFWSWNLIFLAFMSLGFAPIMLPETFIAVRSGVIPGSFLVYALVLALIPVICVILGLTVLRRSPGRLFALGYVIEGPLMLLLAVRFFLIRQTTPGVTVTLLIALLGMAAFLWSLLDSRNGERRIPSERLRLAGLTLMAITSLYAAVWIAFYAFPLSAELLRAIGNFLANFPRAFGDIWRELVNLIRDTPIMLPFSVLGFLLLLYTATLFVLAPIAVPVLSLRAWWRSLNRQVNDLGWVQPLVLVCVVIAVTSGLFVFANRQPQAQAFALLEEPPTTAEAAQELLGRSDAIRAGLLNAYLAPFRYISAEGEVRHIREIYSSAFRISPKQAFTVQRMYEGMASPLLYEPVHRQEFATLTDNRALVEEPREAAQLYQSFFDTPITDGERPTIVAAARATWSPDQAEAAWQAVDDREIYLVRQEVDIQENGDWANLELHEVYQNQTADLQEVIYYFNLPESAVITGVWLGESADKSQAFEYQVAPRGAAQAVYREETRVMRDPALVEQIGPRQYRLRVYPILPLRTTFNQRSARTTLEEAPYQHMWLSWREMVEQSANDDDAWPLPHLAYLRNVYWDDNTQRLVNDQPIEVQGEAWMPESWPTSNPSDALAYRVDLAGGQTAIAMPSQQIDLPSLPDSTQLALVLDRSRSMQPYASDVTKAVADLESFDTADSPVDVYLTASPYRGEQPSLVNLDEINVDEVIYFGGQNAAQLIAQFEQLRLENGNRQYDAVIVLTDGSGYELGESSMELPIPPAPVWVVHLGGDIPLGYDDQTLEVIQASGGGVTGDLSSALSRIAVTLNTEAEPGSPNAPISDLVDGYLWTVLPSEAANAALLPEIEMTVLPADDPFAALAARRLVLAEMQRNRGSIDQLETLDYLHSLAMNYEIVTPYSSMIVLVEADQQRLLDKLSNLDDRYQREVEVLGDTTPNAPVPLAGVPEPHEWLLMALVAALLIYISYTKRKQALARA